ncbi:hypothetical protein [Dyadobacter sp. LHD-138]|uniref:hypothetical protein n=1 Tax=Dyadobacter sp. LHD-138 TaxID=3071413 RepID=UPI0027E0F7A7|nr:hypothetical protein [Dyadobacter sp. LHD-138]MDQ6477858.1 hypothetical protein [Dyadobacter sp. LHD-138]
MKKQITFTILLLSSLLASNAFAQQMQTVFKGRGIQRSGGYAAISNKFTTINGDYANIAEIYGGWFVNSKFLIGLSAAGSTNHIPVPQIYSERPWQKLTYQYGQVGLMTEYVFASNRRVHVVGNLTTGAGFTMQYDRKDWDDFDHWDDRDDDDHEDPNCFFVMEPGVQVEFNLLKWMRFAPGISYRKTFGASGHGLSDADLSNVSYNLTLKFGRF